MKWRVLFFLFIYVITGWVWAESLPSPSSKIAPSTITDSPLTPSLIPISNKVVSAEMMQEIAHLYSDMQAALVQETSYLEREEIALKNRQQDLKKVDDSLLEQAEIDRQTASVEVEKLRLELQSSENSIEKNRETLNELNRHLDNLQKSPISDMEAAVYGERLAELRQHIQIQTGFIQLKERILVTLKERLQLAEVRHRLKNDWYQLLRQQYQQQQQQNLERNMLAKQQEFLLKASDIRQQLEQLRNSNSATDQAQSYLLEARIHELEGRARLVTRELELAYIEQTLSYLQDMTPTEFSLAPQTPDELQNLLLQLSISIKEINELQELLKNKNNLLQQQIDVLKKRQELHSRQNAKLAEIIKDLQSFLDEQQIQSDRLLILFARAEEMQRQLENLYQQALRNTLLRQREIPFNEEGLQGIQNIAQMPHLFMSEVQRTLDGLHRTLQQTKKERWFLIIFASLLWLSFFIWVRMRLKHLFLILIKERKRSFTNNLILLGLRLLQFNTVGIALAVIFILLIFLASPTEAIITLSLLMVSLWFAIKVPLNLTWLILSNRKLFKIKNRSRTFRHFRLGIILTGLLLFITALGHVLPVSLITRDTIDTLFMLFLSWAFFPLIHLRSAMLEFFSRGVKGYWFLVLRVISLLIPLLLLTVSVLGLIGYINLGWYVARNLGLLILILTGWLIMRGFINDILQFFKNLALKHSQYGLLWTQDLIPLIGNVILLFLLILTIALYFTLSGWTKDYGIMAAIQQALSYQLMTLGRETITVLALLKALGLLWFVFWFGSWARRVTYRWIYLGISDLGVRLSLSVFTQYMLVVSGLLITLNLIGIDLTTLTVFLGALGVGIGFGLQTIANNFISGLILLIERPLKTGDFVNIGQNCEGEVTGIGIRSTVVRQWNRQEVIVPNSEVIINAFTNWTHSDHVLRITLYLRISYETEPDIVLKTLQNIFPKLPDVLTDPEPFITLWEFEESWMLFRVDYFFNLKNSDMFATRTKVAMAIWQALKNAGIRVAYPQQDVYLRHSVAQSPLAADVQILPDARRE